MQGIVTGTSYVNKGLTVGADYAGRMISYVSRALDMLHTHTHERTHTHAHTHVHMHTHSHTHTHNTHLLSDHKTATFIRE